jgi:hypothetical protein
VNVISTTGILQHAVVCRVTTVGHITDARLAKPKLRENTLNQTTDGRALFSLSSKREVLLSQPPKIFFTGSLELLPHQR